MKIVNSNDDNFYQDKLCKYIKDNKNMFELFNHFDETQFNDLEINAFNCSIYELYSILDAYQITYHIQPNFCSFVYNYTYIDIYNILNFCDFYQLNFKQLDNFIKCIQTLILINKIIIDKTKLNENMYNLLCSNECYINGKIMCCKVEKEVYYGQTNYRLIFEHDMCYHTHRFFEFDHTYYDCEEIKKYLQKQDEFKTRDYNSMDIFNYCMIAFK
jgi:hypothetical protein